MFRWTSSSSHLPGQKLRSKMKNEHVYMWNFIPPFRIMSWKARSNLAWKFWLIFYCPLIYVIPPRDGNKKYKERSDLTSSSRDRKWDDFVHINRPLAFRRRGIVTILSIWFPRKHFIFSPLLLLKGIFYWKLN